jgi:C-terminal processing protease CtpA/Prc
MIMKRLSWMVAASALWLAPAVARSDTPRTQDQDPWADTQPQATQDTLGQPRLGIRVMDLTSDLRSYFAAPSDHGLLIAKVEQGTAAARAGLKAGDVLVSVQGEAVTSASDVRDALSNAKSGDKLQLDIIRNKKPITLTAAVATDDQTSELEWMHQVLPWFDPDKLETPT